jgi:hypothetical protein
MNHENWIQEPGFINSRKGPGNNQGRYLSSLFGIK